MSLIPQTSFLVRTFFAVSYSKPALVTKMWGMDLNNFYLKLMVHSPAVNSALIHWIWAGIAVLFSKLSILGKDNSFEVKNVESYAL